VHQRSHGAMDQMVVSATSCACLLWWLAAKDKPSAVRAREALGGPAHARARGEPDRALRRAGVRAAGAKARRAAIRSI